MRRREQKTWAKPSPWMQVALLVAVLGFVGIAAGGRHIRTNAEAEQRASALGASSLSSQDAAEEGKAGEPLAFPVADAVKKKKQKTSAPAQKKKNERSSVGEKTSDLVVQNDSEPIEKTPVISPSQDPVPEPAVPAPEPEPTETPRASESVPEKEKDEETKKISVTIATSHPVPASFGVELQEGQTVLDAMRIGKRRGAVSYKTKAFAGLGEFVEAINGVENDDKNGTYWTYYVSGVPATLGVSHYVLRNGDRVEWRFQKGI